ncbi:MAG: M23 family metallopeptidase [Magnetococcales bacterium]|nr:M23 family metallopeptidase [Magnetococcales bacterium]
MYTKQMTLVIGLMLLLQACSAGAKAPAAATGAPVRVASGPPVGSKGSSDRPPQAPQASDRDQGSAATTWSQPLPPLQRPTGVFKEELAPPAPGVAPPLAVVAAASEQQQPVVSSKGDDKGGNIWLARSAVPHRWQWPANGDIITHFGTFGAKRSNGIEIKLPAGTAVVAAAAGVVAYADDKLPGYGKMVIVSHGGSHVTTYAHNQTLLVRRGQRLTAGQKIAASGSVLYFEIRRNKTPDNPLKYLPKS